MSCHQRVHSWTLVYIKLSLSIQPGGVGGAVMPPGTAARKMPGAVAVRYLIVKRLALRYLHVIFA